ncbi:transposase [Syntrophomonas curvata]
MGARRRYSEDEKLNIITRCLRGETLADISRDTGIHQVLISRWRKEYSETGRFGKSRKTASNSTIPKELQDEMRHLKKRIEDKNLEIAVLRDMLKKNS